MKQEDDSLLSFATVSVATAAQIITIAGRRIKKVRNILYKRNAISLLSIFVTCVAIFLMTGALYFRNEVIIIDNGNTYRVFTMQSEPANILAEQGFKLTGIDMYSFDGFEEGIATLKITRSFPITIRADGVNIKTEAFEGEKLWETLNRNGINLAVRDLVSPPLEHIMTENGDDFVKITRAFEITVYIDGESVELPVTPDGKTTVYDVLKLEGIGVGGEVVTTQRLSSLAFPGMEAEINLVSYINRTVTGTIPYETITHTSNLKKIGDKEVLVEGVPGSERLTIIDTLIDGVVVDSEVVEVVVLKEPVAEVVVEGLALAVPYSKRDFDEIELVDGRPVNYEFKISGKATAYTAGPRGGTASGRKLEVGTIAVNPRQIPYGSLVYIVTQCGTTVYGAAVAADTGTFFYDTDIVVDVFKGLTSTSYSEALRWGLKSVDVYVINTGVY